MAIRGSFKKLFSSREGDDRTALSKRIQAAPEDPQARQKLGVFLLKQGEVVEGIDQLARAAVLYEKSGFAAKAIAVLRQMLKHDPGNIDLQRWLVRLLAQQGLTADALHELERITSGKGVRFSSDDQKIEFLRQAAEHLSGHPLPLLLIVDILRSQRKFFEAVTEMEKAAPLAVASGQVGAFGDRLKGLIAMAGTNLDSLESFGFLWLRVGNVEAGQSVLGQVVQMTRKVGHAANFESMERVMAAIAQGRGVLRQATSFADAARILAAPPPAPKAAAPAPPPRQAGRTPESREAPGPRGTASPGRPPEKESPPAGTKSPGEAATEEEDLVRSAIGLLQEKVREQIGESDHEARYNLGIAYKEMGLLDEAIEEFRVSRRKPDLFIGASTMLAETLAERGDIDAAMEALNETLGSDRVLGTQARDILYQKGILLEKAGKAGEAMEIFLALYEEAPDYRDVRGRTEGYRK